MPAMPKRPAETSTSTSSCEEDETIEKAFADVNHIMAERNLNAALQICSVWSGYLRTVRGNPASKSKSTSQISQESHIMSPCCVKRLRTSDESKPQNKSKSAVETPQAKDTNTTRLEIVTAEPWEITAGIMEDNKTITLVDQMNQALVRLQEKTVDYDVLRQASDRPKDKVNYIVPDSQSQSKPNSGGDGGEELAPVKKEPEESSNRKDDGASLR